MTLSKVRLQRAYDEPVPDDGARGEAEFISEFAWGALRVGLRGHRPQFGWWAGSLVEVMYLQLLEHVTQHPDTTTLAARASRPPWSMSPAVSSCPSSGWR
jgi:hypothetical protein